jgi:hypothetical protein
VIGAEEGVDEEPRDVDVGRVDAGEAGDQRVPEVEVGAVRLVGELPELRVALALGDRDRVHGLVGRAGGLLLLCGRGGLGLEVVVGALDRGLDELSVERAVNDDRPAALELDQHSRGARLVDVLVAEAHLRRPVGVAVELPVERFGQLVELLGLLAQAQLGDLAAAGAVQVGREHLAVTAVGQRGIEDPAGLPGQALGGPGVAIVEVGDHGVEQAGRRLADRAELVDGGQVDHAVADQLLRALRELEDLHARGDAALGPAEPLRGAVLGQAAVKHRPDRARLLEGIQLLARDVLDRPIRVLGVDVAHDDRHVGEPERLRRGDPVKARDELEAVVPVADDNRHEHPLQRDRAGQRLDVLGIEVADVLRDADLAEGHTAPGLLDGGGHQALPWSCGPPRWRPDPPPPRTPARACHPQVAGRPVSERSRRPAQRHPPTVVAHVPHGLAERNTLAPSPNASATLAPTRTTASRPVRARSVVQRALAS